MLDVETRKERPPLVRFEKVAVEDVPASRAAGRYVARDVDFALVTPPYSKDIFKQEVRDYLDSMKRERDAGRFLPEWFAHIERAYAEWQRGNEIPLNGTPVKGWGLISPAQQENLIRLNILTVEDVANMNEEGQRRVGMGALDLQRKAKAWLAELSGGGKNAMEVAALQGENERLKADIAKLTGQVQELMTAVRVQGTVNAAAVEPPLQEGIQATDIIDDPEESLVDAYTQKFGKPPRANMKPETIRAALGLD